MDSARNAVQLSACGDRLLALLLLVSPLWAQENSTAYEALRVVGSQLGRRRFEPHRHDYRQERQSAAREMENSFGGPAERRCARTADCRR